MKKICTQSLFTNSYFKTPRYKNFGRLIKVIISMLFLMILQNVHAQTICPCGVIVQQGQPCPCHNVYRDADGDGYGNIAISQSIKNGDPTPNGYVNNSTDCNDSDNTIYPGAPELCDGKDHNCNGINDNIYYRDFDGDGYGDPNDSLLNCGGQPAGYVSNKNDCDDNDPSKRNALTWVKDADNDGRYVGSPVTACSSPGAGYVIKTTQQPGDFNDNDPLNSTILYVNANAGGTVHDGTSWAHAYTKLQDALTNTPGYINQIWVAAGTYYPDEGGGKTNNDPTAAFNMKNGIAIYGGFTGTEISLFQRNWVQNKTILSGDINQDGTYAGNSSSVIVNINVNSTALLDGFTITKANCFIAPGGGGMANIESTPVITNCIFSLNKAPVGGGIFNQDASPLLTDCSFFQDSAVTTEGWNAGKGGAIYNYASGYQTSAPVMINCTFSKNAADSTGSVIYSWGAKTTITNSIIWGNNSSSIAFYAPIYSEPSFVITYSIVQGGYTGTGNLNADPLFVNATGNDFHLQLGSPATDVGLDSVNKEILDLGTSPRKAGNIDIGAYEYAKQCNAYAWIKDADGDNYYNGGQIYQCTWPGVGYKLLTTQQPGDCNDNDSTINPKTVWYLDADSDGYKDPNYIGQPSCTAPQDGKHYTTVIKGSDCNDNNAAQNPETIWVKDADGDGYYTGNIILGCLGLTGYKIRTNELPGDCDDNNPSVHPGAIEIANGIDDNCDGQIDEGICGVATNFTVTNVTTTSATLSWNAGTNAVKYNLSYKAGNVSTWTSIKNIKGTTYNFTGLSPYYAYDYKVQTVCGNGAKSAFSKVYSFTTSYGGPVYCTIKGNTFYEYIDKVVVGTAILNKSGDDNGYGNYFALNATVTAGSGFEVKLTPGFHYDPYPEYWEVYIDYNQDGLLRKQDGERAANGHKSGTLSKIISVPLTAKNGPTRMRIIMHYDSSLNKTCGDFVDGEAEDYTLFINGGTGTVAAMEAAQASAVPSILVIPNPINNSSATVELNLTKEGNASVRIVDVSGKMLYKKDVTNLHTGKNPVTLNGLENLANGTYFIEAQQNGIIIGRAQIIISK